MIFFLPVLWQAHGPTWPIGPIVSTLKNCLLAKVYETTNSIKVMLLKKSFLEFHGASIFAPFQDHLYGYFAVALGVREEFPISLFYLIVLS